MAVCDVVIPSWNGRKPKNYVIFFVKRRWSGGRRVQEGPVCHVMVTHDLSIQGTIFSPDADDIRGGIYTVKGNERAQAGFAAVDTVSELY